MLTLRSLCVFWSLYASRILFLVLSGCPAAVRKAESHSHARSCTALIRITQYVQATKRPCSYSLRCCIYARRFRMSSVSRMNEELRCIFLECPFTSSTNRARDWTDETAKQQVRDVTPANWHGYDSGNRPMTGRLIIRLLLLDSSAWLSNSWIRHGS